MSVNSAVRYAIEDGLILHAAQSNGYCNHCLHRAPCQDRILYERLERELGLLGCTCTLASYNEEGNLTSDPSVMGTLDNRGCPTHGADHES